jgi:hypothetical protein
MVHQMEDTLRQMRVELVRRSFDDRWPETFAIFVRLKEIVIYTLSTAVFAGLAGYGNATMWE